MFSQTAEYALRTMVWVAAQDGAPRTTQQIAEATRVPAGYLAKVLQTLTRQRLLVSQRGINGGFVLARAANRISVWEVIEAVDPIRRIEKCPLRFKAHRKKLCPLHRSLDQAISTIESKLKKAKISDMVRSIPGKSPWCA